MLMKAKEMEKIILADGWMFKSQEGSHKHYTHPTKPEYHFTEKTFQKALKSQS